MNFKPNIEFTAEDRCALDYHLSGRLDGHVSYDSDCLKWMQETIDRDRRTLRRNYEIAEREQKDKKRERGHLKVKHSDLKRAKGLFATGHNTEGLEILRYVLMTAPVVEDQQDDVPEPRFKCGICGRMNHATYTGHCPQCTDEDKA